ncbi:MAG: class I SAM-dependent methyltransferase [Trueperaceae bacterium]|nr:class I SAM-dependent methyltransferase [Trueperaceae bacterium]
MRLNSKRKLIDEHFDLGNFLIGEQDFPLAGYEDTLDLLIKKANLAKGMTVLDYGVGMGQLTERLLNKGARVTALDYSSDMLRKARVKFPGVFFIQADLSKPLRLGRFDRVVSSYVLHEYEHLKKWQIIAQTLTYLKPEGRLLIADIAFSSRHDLALCYERNKHLWNEEDHYWVAEEMQASLPQNILMSYEQVSSCAGLFIFEKTS